MKTLSKLVLQIALLLFVFSFLTNCKSDDLTNDNIETLTQDEPLGLPIETRKVDINEISGLDKYLRRFSVGSQARITGSNIVVTPFGNIPLEDITEVIDAIGNANYTFIIIPNTYRANKFYNLVVHQAPDEEDYTSFVMEYDLEESYADNYINGLAGLIHLTGNLRMYSTEEFLALTGNEGSRACGEETGNSIEPCVESDIDNSDGGPASNDGSYQDESGEGDSDNGDPVGGEGPDFGDGSVGGGSIGASRPCWATLYIMNCGGTNQDQLHLFSECGASATNQANGDTYFINNCSDGIQRASGRDVVGCPIVGGPAAISPVPFASLGTAFGLTPAEEACLGGPNNCDLKNDIYQFLNANILPDGSNWEQDAMDFAGLVLDELLDDCNWDFEVDYEEQIIYADAILEYPCQVQLIKQANNETGPLANLFQDIFNNSDRAALRYFASNLSPQTGANTIEIDDNLILTTMNTWRLENSTDLDIVKTTIHEMIHATLLYMWNNPYNDFGIGNVDPSYNELVDFFNEYRFFGDSNTSQHEYMTLLVSDIANALETWADANGYENVDSSYFTKLAWGGLTMTDSFDFYHPSGSQGRIEIEQAISNELSSFSDAEGTQASTINCD